MTMQKFMVIVNNRFVLLIEAQTNGGAEHKVFDACHNIDIESCQAFGMSELGTEFFQAMVAGCEIKSLSDLTAICNKIKEAQDRKQECVERIEDLKSQISDLEFMLSVHKRNLEICQQTENDLLGELK